MSDADFYDDDFDSDGGRSASPRSSRSPSPRSARSPSPRMTSSMMPKIVELPTPSESSAGLDSARSDEMSTHRSDHSDPGSEDEEESDDDAENTPQTRHSRPASARKAKKHKHKVKNGRFHVDMTPPDKHLKKAERKAKKYMDRKKVDNGMKCLVQCTALARIVYGDGHWKLAKAYVNLAEAYLDKKGWAAQAQYHADFAKSIMMSGVQLSNSSTEKPAIMEVLVNIYYTLGKALTILKKYNDADQALNKAEKLAKERSKCSNVKDRDVESWKIKICLAIARLNARQKKFAVATTNFEKALDLMEKKHGPDGVELIPVYQALGKVEQSKGDHANHTHAIENFLQAHSIAAAHYKDNSVEVAETARGLATAYSNTGDEDAEASAESYLNECLAIYQTIYGPHHTATIDTEDELCRLMIRMERPEEALGILKAGMEAKKEVYGDLSAEVADTWKLMGNVHLSQGDAEKALRALKKCHNVQCSVYGTNNKNSKDTQRTIDILMANPNLAAKQKKSSAEQMKERPRFNTIVKGSKSIGGTKIPD